MKKQIILAIVCFLVLGLILTGCTETQTDTEEDEGSNNGESETTEGSINFFTVTPDEITIGENATLSWNVTGASSISIDNGIGTFDPIGNIIISPTQTTTYKLTADFSANVIIGSSHESVTIKVRSGLPIIIDLSVSEWDDESNNIIWEVTGVEGGPITSDEIVAFLVDENDNLVIGTTTQIMPSGLIYPGSNFTVIAPSDGFYIFKITEETEEGPGDVFFESDLTKY